MQYPFHRTQRRRLCQLSTTTLVPLLCSLLLHLQKLGCSSIRDKDQYCHCPMGRLEWGTLSQIGGTNHTCSPAVMIVRAACITEDMGSAATSVACHTHTRHKQIAPVTLMLPHLWCLDPYIGRSRRPCGRYQSLYIVKINEDLTLQKAHETLLSFDGGVELQAARITKHVIIYAATK